MLKLYTIAIFIGGLVNTLFALFVYFKNRQNSSNRAYGIFSAVFAIWSFSWGALLLVDNNKNLALFLARLLNFGATFIPIAYLYWILTVLNLQKKYRKFLCSGYFLSFILATFSFSSLYIKDTHQILFFRYWPTAGPLYWVYLFLSWGIFLSCGIVFLIKYYFKTTGYKQQQIRYILLGTVMGFGSGAFNFPLEYGSTFFNSIIIFIAVFIFILSPLPYVYATVKYRLMDIRLAFTRTGIFLVVYAIVLGLPFFVASRTNSDFIQISFAIVVATVGPVIYRLLQKKAENVILAQQKRYQRALINAGKGMVREHDLNKLMRLIVRVVKMTVKIEFVGAFLKDKEKQCFRLTVARGNSNLPDTFTLPLDHPLVHVIEKKQDPVVYEEINPSVDDAFVKSIHLVVPSFAGDEELLGFLILGEKADQSVYTQDDIDVFRILSHQASLAIENCLFVEETKESQRRLFQAEKLASIGGMADGVAHQIKNRLNHFSIASGEAQYEIQDFIKAHPEMVEQSPDLKKTFEYLAKIAQSLIENVKRTNSVIQGILNYARVEEKDTFFSTFNVNEILNLSLELLRVKHEIAVFPLVIEGDVNMEIYGVKAQIMEAVYNILDNCYEAVQEKFKYNLSPEEQDKFQHDIRLKFSQDAAKSIIEIKDNGIGIKDDDHHKIFAPFFTTKSSYKSGSGIGMYVVKRMIEENHNGKITFQSEYMKGTYFRIELPKKA